MLVLPNELTQAQAGACLRMLLQGLREHSEAEVVIDASVLQRFDSSALAVLLEARRESLALGRRFSIRNLPQRLRNLAGLYGVLELLSEQ